MAIHDKSSPIGAVSFHTVRRHDTRELRRRETAGHLTVAGWRSRGMVQSSEDRPAFPSQPTLRFSRGKTLQREAPPRDSAYNCPSSSQWLDVLAAKLQRKSRRLYALLCSGIPLDCTGGGGSRFWWRLRRFCGNCENPVPIVHCSVPSEPHLEPRAQSLRRQVSGRRQKLALVIFCLGSSNE